MLFSVRVCLLRSLPSLSQPGVEEEAMLYREIATLDDEVRRIGSHVLGA